MERIDPTLQSGTEPASLAEARLDLLQAALDHINQGFTVFDADLRLVAWNTRLFDMLDLPLRLAIRGTHLADYFRVIAERGEYGEGDVEDQVKMRVERALAFQPHYFERMRPTGQIIAVQGTPLPMGGFVTTYTDVTQERHYQEELEKTVEERTRALRQSEDWLRVVMDNVPALIAYMAPGPIYHFANRRYAEWFGHTPETIQNRLARDVIGAPLFDQLEPEIRRVFAGRAVSYEYNRADDTGKPVYMRSTLIPDMDTAGNVLGCFVLSLDITEQKHSETVLVETQRMEAVGQLTGGLAHDFNNLLTVIIGNLLALRGDALQAWAEDREGPIARIDPALHAAQRGAELTKRLLAFARGEPLDPSEVNIGTLVDNVVQLLRGSLPKNISLEAPGSEDPLHARIDPGQFENALVNLALNARDAFEGGGTIRIEVSQRHFSELEAEELGIRSGIYANIAVTDNGSGMDSTTQRHAFEPFYTTKKFGTGSGLGLAMVYGFSKQSGGLARLHSETGMGTTVSLLLPVISAADVHLDEELEEAIPDNLGQERLILLVEDEPDVATIVSEQLQQLGFNVLVVHDAKDALELISDIEDIEFMLSDIVMPGDMDGIQLAGSAKKIRPGLRIALMSGYRHSIEADYDRPEKMDAIRWPVLAKPFNLVDLARTLNVIS
ncbi:MAG: PAS-domain containing protein [Stappiaceae bacterium]